ncbi:MAG: hypothetical protein LBT00_02840 [Spirochaetaceae bacterium]|nr:hypothetical protein [Spirochaetaceae bacterium]
MVLVLAAMVAGSVFAEEAEQPKKDERSAFRHSVGVGGFIGGDFGGGFEGTGKYYGASYSREVKMPYFGGGGFVFFDSTYTELVFGLYGGGGTAEVTEGSISSEYDMSYMNFNIGLLGKFPFTINQKLSIFPLLGIELDVVLSAEADGKEYKGKSNASGTEDLSTFWFKFGAGLDYSFAERIFLRFEALYGFRVANKAETDMEKTWDKSYYDADTEKLLGHGLTVKIGVGYKY